MTPLPHHTTRGAALLPYLRTGSCNHLVFQAIQHLPHTGHGSCKAGWVASQHCQATHLLLHLDDGVNHGRSGPTVTAGAARARRPARCGRPSCRARAQVVRE